MFQWLYDVLWLLAPIWIRRYLDKRSGSAPAYRAHRGERFGKPYPNPVTGAVWIHRRFGRGNACRPTFDTRVAAAFSRRAAADDADDPDGTGNRAFCFLMRNAAIFRMTKKRGYGSFARTPPDVRRIDGNGNLAQPAEANAGAWVCRCFWRMRGCRKNR